MIWSRGIPEMAMPDTCARPARRLTRLLMALMFTQALLGLMRLDQYRDAAWIAATWYGNDWVTMLAAVPLLWVGIRAADRRSARGQPADERSGEQRQRPTRFGDVHQP
jgi:hypothetical protein